MELAVSLSDVWNGVIVPLGVLVALVSSSINVIGHFSKNRIKITFPSKFASFYLERGIDSGIKFEGITNPKDFIKVMSQPIGFAQIRINNQSKFPVTIDDAYFYIKGDKGPSKTSAQMMKPNNPMILEGGDKGDVVMAMADPFEFPIRMDPQDSCLGRLNLPCLKINKPISNTCTVVLVIYTPSKKYRFKVDLKSKKQLLADFNTNIDAG